MVMLHKRERRKVSLCRKDVLTSIGSYFPLMRGTSSFYCEGDKSPIDLQSFLSYLTNASCLIKALHTCSCLVSYGITDTANSFRVIVRLDVFALNPFVIYVSLEMHNAKITLQSKHNFYCNIL